VDRNKGTVSPVFLPPPGEERRREKYEVRFDFQSCLPKNLQACTHPIQQGSKEKTGGNFNQFDFRICSAVSQAIIPGRVIRLARKDLLSQKSG
jgi:hypothetical protein